MCDIIPSLAFIDEVLNLKNLRRGKLMNLVLLHCSNLGFPRVYSVAPAVYIYIADFRTEFDTSDLSEWVERFHASSVSRYDILVN